MLANRIALPEHEDAVHEAVDALVGPTYRNLGFDAASDEGDRTPSLRSLAINLMGTVGADPGVRDEAAHRFDASPIGGGSGARHPRRHRVGDPGRRRPTGAARRLRRVVGALPLRSDTTGGDALPRRAGQLPRCGACLRTFDLALTEVRTQNGFSVIAALLANRVGNQAVWRRITETWGTILERFPKNAPPRILESLPALLRDADFARGAIEFLEDHPLASGPRRVAQSAERLNVNVAFAARERPGLADALRAAGTHDAG